LPGEAVSVGYVDDKREHPIILGIGDNVVQTPAKVTLGPTLNVEGENNTLTDPTEDPGFLPLNCEDFLTDSLTGSTTTLTVDCSTLDITGCFRAQIEAPSDCGCGVYDWSLSGGLVGFTTSNDGLLATAVGLTITLAPFGVGNSQLKICPPINVPTVLGLAYTKQAYTQGCGHVSGAAHAGGVTHCRFGCDDVRFVCSNSTLGSKIVNMFLGGPTDCSGGDNCNNHFGHCNFSNPANCPSNISPHRNIDCARISLGNINDGIEQFGIVNDFRTQQMKDDGCAPCKGLLADSIITATDACGRIISLDIEIES